MRNTKLIKTLSTFSTEEAKDFRRFVDSPFFNREGKYVLRFYDELMKYHPSFDDLPVRESLHAAVYAGKKYDDVIIRKMSSVLQKLAEDFMSYEAFSKLGTQKELISLKNFRERALSDSFELKVNELTKALDDPAGSIDLEHYRNKFRLEIEKINYFMESNSFVKEQRKSMENVQLHAVCDGLMNLLDIAYNIHVGLTTMFASDSNIALKLLDHTSVEPFLKELSKVSPNDHAIIELFYLRYLSMVSFDDLTYKRFKRSALRNLALFTRDNRFTMMVALQNFCIRKFVSGERNYAVELHDIHKEMLKGGLLINERSGFINLSSYRNIILTAVNLRKFDWMDKFINEYRERLLPDQRESVTAWARSTSLYSQKKFEEALGELHKVKNDHFLTKHDIRILQMKIYYELRDYDSAFSAADAYKKMVENDKVTSDLHRKSNRNFASFYIRLIRYVSENRYKDLGFLKHEIETTPCNSKEWFLERLENEISKARPHGKP
ncbi:MAG: hypothetical protein K1X85_09500 [Ignavibacteria bacterium]|nr:hypothetical protein [Ignavibacteria bacterium]